VEFTNGTHERYQANVIAENMYAQVDNKGNKFLLLKEITDHKSNGSTIQIADGTIQSAKWHGKAKEDNTGMVPFSTMEKRNGKLGKAV
jgi:hypothetical protein